MQNRRVATLLSGVIIAISLALTTMIIAMYLRDAAVDKPFFLLDWGFIHPGLQGWHLDYTVYGFFNPPWSAILLLPLGAFPVHIGGALIIVVTLLALVVSVPRTPRRWLFLLTVLLTVGSFHAIRLMVDGNFEGIILLGVLLAMVAYKQKRVWLLFAASLLMTLKPQMLIVMLPVLGLYLLKTWRWQQMLKFSALVGVIVAVSMLIYGQAWLDAVIDIPNVGLHFNASLWRLDESLEISPVFPMLICVALLVVSGWLLWRDDQTLNRYKVAMLVCISALLAPYSTGNVLVIVIALALTKLLQERFWQGLLLFICMDVSFAMPYASNWIYSGTLVTFQLLAVWFAIVLNRDLWWRLPARQTQKDIFMG